MMTIIEQSMRTRILAQKSIIISRKWIVVYGKGGRNIPQPYDHIEAYQVPPGDNVVVCAFAIRNVKPLVVISVG